MGKANKGKDSNDNKPVIYYSCWIKYGNWEALITEWPSLFNASEYATGRLSAIVPGKNLVIQLVGKLRISINYKEEIPEVLDKMVLVILKNIK